MLMDPLKFGEKTARYYDIKLFTLSQVTRSNDQCQLFSMILTKVRTVLLNRLRMLLELFTNYTFERHQT